MVFPPRSLLYNIYACVHGKAADKEYGCRAWRKGYIMINMDGWLSEGQGWQGIVGLGVLYSRLKA